MARANIELRKTDSVFEEIERLQETVRRRAYECFRSQTGAGALADWLSAERELLWKPAVELRQKDGQIEILAAIPGVEAGDLDIQVTPEDVLIKANIHHGHTAAKGTVRICEFAAGALFRPIHLPERIDPDSATVDYRNGMLRLTAAIATSRPAKKLKVKAASAAAPPNTDRRATGRR